jgi:hypothetical protein
MIIIITNCIKTKVTVKIVTVITKMSPFPTTHNVDFLHWLLHLVTGVYEAQFNHGCVAHNVKTFALHNLVKYNNKLLIYTRNVTCSDNM